MVGAPSLSVRRQNSQARAANATSTPSEMCISKTKTVVWIEVTGRQIDESQQLRMVRTYAPCVAVVEANLLEDALFRRIYRNIRAVVWATQVV